jgi:hypothetical protein
MNALELLREHEDVLRKRFSVQRIGIFGSFARGEDRQDSDVDVLVLFMDGQKTFDNYMNLKFYLEDVFGRNVDLVIETSIKPRLKDHILREAVYA